MTIAPEAYPQQQGGGNGSSSGNPDSGVGGGGPGSGPVVPFFNSVPALETFLMNRISDTAKSRQSIDNMLQSRQLSAAENLVRELVLTAKYQPELHTIPYEERQRILGFSERIRSLSDSLGSRNYAEIRKLAEEVESISKDPGMADVKSFAEAHPKRALQWVKQAEVAMKVGDQQSMRSLMKAAHDLAPLDPEVTASLRRLETDLLEGGELRNDLLRLVEADNYEEIYRRRSDFARFYGSDAEPDLKEKVEALLEKETSIQEALKKCEEFADRSSHPDAWIALSELVPELSRDERIKALREKTEVKCRVFASAYDSARAQEEAGNLPVALAWYLTALAEAPATTVKLKPRIEELGQVIAND